MMCPERSTSAKKGHVFTSNKGEVPPLNAPPPPKQLSATAVQSISDTPYNTHTDNAHMVFIPKKSSGEGATFLLMFLRHSP